MIHQQPCIIVHIMHCRSIHGFTQSCESHPSPPTQILVACKPMAMIRQRGFCTPVLSLYQFVNMTTLTYAELEHARLRRQHMAQLGVVERRGHRYYTPRIGIGNRALGMGILWVAPYTGRYQAIEIRILPWLTKNWHLHHLCEQISEMQTFILKVDTPWKWYEATKWRVYTKPAIIFMQDVLHQFA